MTTSLAKVKRAVCVVAHPDDETLWGGGLLLTTSDRIAWTVVCCSMPRLDPIRAVKFKHACGALGVRTARVIPRPEVAPPALLSYLDDELPLLSLGDWDLIVTHNAAGEYGHPHHAQLFRWLSARFRHVAVFGYKAGSGLAGYEVRLTAAEWRRKLEALQCYNHLLPYEGRMMPKWEALVQRYGKRFDLRTEVYGGLTA